MDSDLAKESIHFMAYNKLGLKPYIFKKVKLFSKEIERVMTQDSSTSCASLQVKCNFFQTKNFYEKDESVKPKLQILGH